MGGPSGRHRGLEYLALAGFGGGPPVGHFASHRRRGRSGEQFRRGSRSDRVGDIGVQGDGGIRGGVGLGERRLEEGLSDRGEQSFQSEFRRGEFAGGGGDGSRE